MTLLPLVTATLPAPEVTSADVVYVVGGIGLLVAAVLPRLLKGRAISVAMGFTAVGLLVGLLPLPLPALEPEANGELVERLTEFAVIVALMGVGLALDRPLSWKAWRTTWRLLLIGMPLLIAAVAVMAWGMMGLLPASALLLAAVLAPTDPVLAGDVQVDGPNTGEEDEVRFGLTSEAGLNDGLAFPFVYLALFVGASQSIGEWGLRWLAWELAGKVAIGIGVGAAVGWLLARAAFRTPRPALRFAQAGEAVVALGAVLLAYGLAETAQGYGFLAVFAAALVIRTHERDNEYHEVLHSFIDQVEQILTMVLLLLFGVACARGMLDELTLSGAVVGILVVAVVRPVTGWLSLVRCSAPRRERLALAFFGVRGIGSFYYLGVRDQPRRVLRGQRALVHGGVHGAAVGGGARRDRDTGDGVARPRVGPPGPCARPGARAGRHGRARCRHCRCHRHRHRRAAPPPRMTAAPGRAGTGLTSRRPNPAHVAESVATRLSTGLVVLALLVSVTAPGTTQRWGWVVLVAGLLAGLPHGAVDHLLPALRLGRRAPRLVAVVVAYAATAAAAWALFRLWPGPALVGFVLLSVWHFGWGEVAFDDTRAGRPPRRDPLAVLATGGSALLLPVVGDPAAVAPVIAVLVPGRSGELPGWLPVVVVGLVAAAVLVTVARHLRAGRRLAAAETLLLLALGLLAPPLVAFGVYFGGWHAVRHVALLLTEDPTSAVDLSMGRLPAPVGRFCLRAALPTVAALALLASLWSVADGWRGFVAANLALLAGLTVPHALMVSWWDRSRRPGLRR